MDDERVEVVELETRTEHVARVAAIDIAKASAMVCTRLPGEKNPDRRVQRTWPVKATTAAITELADHLAAAGVELVVMEATGVFWKPFYFLLEARGLRCQLVNARDVRGRLSMHFREVVGCSGERFARLAWPMAIHASRLDRARAGLVRTLSPDPVWRRPALETLCSTPARPAAKAIVELCHD